MNQEETPREAPKPRYEYVEVFISKKEQDRYWANTEEALKEKLAYLKGELRDSEDELKKFLMTSPRDTKSIRKQITLYPGDEGYENAPPVFRPIDYVGELNWVRK